MKWFSFLSLLVCLSACKQLPFVNSPLVELNENNNVLIVNNFKWGYGTAAINQFSGDFETLDKEVFEALKGKTGTCIVKFKNTDKTKYGSDTTSLVEIGNIELKELNRYKDWEFWHKAGGIKTLLYKKYIASQEASKTIDSDTTATDSTEYFERLKQQSVAPIEYIKREPVVFKYADLYPLQEDYDSIAPNGPSYEFVGSIKEVKEFEGGTMILIAIEQGEFNGSNAIVMFYPSKCSDFTARRFLATAEVGASINAKCVRGTNDTFDLVSAEITFNQ